MPGHQQDVPGPGARLGAGILFKIAHSRPSPLFQSRSASMPMQHVLPVNDRLFPFRGSDGSADQTNSEFSTLMNTDTSFGIISR